MKPLQFLLVPRFIVIGEQALISAKSRRMNLLISLSLNSIYVILNVRIFISSEFNTIVI